MTEDNTPPAETTGTPQQKSEVEKLRDEFTEQFSTTKAAFEKEIAELKASNAALSAHNKELERALIRTTVTDPPAPQPTEKTEKEKYEEYINALAKKAIERF